MAQTAIDIALRKLIATSDRESQFETKIQTQSAPEITQPSPSTCQVRRDQIRALWEKVEKSYESCSELLSVADDGAVTSTVLEAKYSYCCSVYSRCVTQLQKIIERGAAQSTLASSSVHTPPSTGCRLPPVDTEVFAGDYLCWPTFRDLFTAIYINNSRVTPVEKLFHLLSKTSGGANAIDSKAPLANEGFVSAWRSLTDRFENRRLLFPGLKQQYVDFMDDYLKRGHMELMPAAAAAEDSPHCNYLAHHAVFKPDSTTTRCRVVLDSSGKDSTGQSLNSRLLIRPAIQRDLNRVCLR
ncbi:hypothetical protein KR200_010813, partial [Drosophila serrata]